MSTLVKSKATGISSKKRQNFLVHIVLIIGAFIMVVPFIWMVLSSFKSNEEISRIPITIWPYEFILDNYISALNLLPFVDLYTNTLVLIFWRVLCAVVFCSMAGYAFARVNFKGRNILFALVIAQMMIPSQVFIIPQYIMVSNLKMLNTMFALVFPGIVSAFGTFLLRQAYMSMPREMEEAAVLDGCNRFQVFYKIMLPLSTTSLSSLAVFTALFAWKDLMWPLIVNIDINMMTLSPGISSLQGQYEMNYNIVLAGTVLATVPIIIIYAFLQKRFIQGIALSGTKA